MSNLGRSQRLGLSEAGGVVPSDLQWKGITSHVHGKVGVGVGNDLTLKPENSVSHTSLVWPMNWYFSRAQAKQNGARESPEPMVIAFSQADAVQRVVLHPRKMVTVVWRMTQHRDPGNCPCSLLLSATNPTLSPGYYSLLQAPSAGAQAEWLWTQSCAFSM